MNFGARMYLTMKTSWLKNRSCSPKHSDNLTDNENVPVLYPGDVGLTTSYNHGINVKNVLCMRSLATNFLPVSELKMNGNNVIL